jgi:urocanate hydratase
MIVSKVDDERIDMQSETSYIDMKNEDLDKYVFTHSDILGRILFIYAKLNPGIMYV